MADRMGDLGLPGRRDQIKAGSVWRSRDPRDNGRLVTVVKEPSTHGNDFVTVRSARRSRLRVVTLLERYNLVKEADRG